MSEVLPEKNRIKITRELCFDLIDIEVNHIRSIPFLGSFKDIVVHCLTETHSFYDLTDHSAIEEIYSFFEERKKKECEFRTILDIENNNDKNNYFIDGSFSVLEKLFDIVNRIYYICQSYLSSKYPMYELEDVFSEITYKFAKEVDIPYRKALNIHSSKSNFNLDLDRKIYNIKDLNNNHWFEKSYEYFKDEDWYDKRSEHRACFINKITSPEKEKNVIQKAKNDPFMEKLRKRMELRDTPERRRADLLKHKHYLVHDILLEDGKYDHETVSFSSLNHVGLQRLIKHKFTYGRDKTEHVLLNKDISSKIDNETLNELMEVFPEMSLSGDIIETGEISSIDKELATKFKDKNGNITTEKLSYAEYEFTNLVFSVSDKATLSENAERDLYTICDVLFNLKHRISDDGNIEVLL